MADALMPLLFSFFLLGLRGVGVQRLGWRRFSFRLPKVQYINSHVLKEVDAYEISLIKLLYNIFLHQMKNGTIFMLCRPIRSHATNR